MTTFSTSTAKHLSSNYARLSGFSLVFAAERNKCLYASKVYTSRILRRKSLVFSLIRELCRRLRQKKAARFQTETLPSEQGPRRQQLFMLVASGAPRDENWAAGRWGCLRVICATQTPPLDSRFRGNDEKGDGNDEIGRFNGSRIFWYE